MLASYNDYTIVSSTNNDFKHDEYNPQLYFIKIVFLLKYAMKERLYTWLILDY